LNTHATAGVDAGVRCSSSLSGGSVRGHRSGSSSSVLHTWGGSSSSPGSSSRQRAAAVPRLSAQGVLAAAAAAGGGGGPTSPGGLLTPVILLRFPSCRLEGAVVKMVGADHRRNQSPCEDVVAWRTPLGERQQVRYVNNHPLFMSCHARLKMADGPPVRMRWVALLLCNQSPCSDVVAWRTPLGDRQQVRYD
jgi:hypothetical protein